MRLYLEFSSDSKNCMDIKIQSCILKWNIKIDGLWNKTYRHSVKFQSPSGAKPKVEILSFIKRGIKRKLVLFPQTIRLCRGNSYVPRHLPTFSSLLFRRVLCSGCVRTSVLERKWRPNPTSTTSRLCGVSDVPPSRPSPLDNLVP